MEERGSNGKEIAFLFWGKTFSGNEALPAKEKCFLDFVKWFFLWSVAPPARGAGGIPTSPLCPPGPPIPPSNGRGIPPDPPVPKGVLPLVSRPTGSVSGTPFGLAWGQQPIGCRGGYTPCMALVPRHVLPHGGTIAAIPCHDSKDRPAPGSRGRDQLRRRRQWPSQGRM